MIRSTSISLLAALFLLAAVAAQPAWAQSRWYKGNTHTHTLWSDGNDFPEMVVDWYASRDYHFLVLSDHNILSKGERWMKLRDINRRGGALALGKYLKRFGDEWVEQRGEGDAQEVRLKPLDEFRVKFEKPEKFLLIQGEEITDRFERYPVHINAVNLQELIRPQGGKSVSDTIARNIAAVKAQSEKTGKPIIAHLNHPNFGWGVTAEDLADVIEERFFEVYNAHPGVRHRGDDKHASVERLWDIANTLRIAKMQAPPLYGLGTDDSHQYHGRGGDAYARRRSEPGRAWVMVRAAKLDADTLVRAMESGDFYSSSGVTLKDVVFDKEANKLKIAIQPDSGATYMTHFIGTLEGYDDSSHPVLDDKGNPIRATRRYSKDVGAVLAKVEGLNPTYQLTGKELYVRAVVFSSKKPAKPLWGDQVQQAWTQPVGWHHRVKMPAKRQQAGE